GSEQCEKFAVADLEVDAAQRVDGTVTLDDALQLDHRRPPPFTAPTVRPFTMCFCANRPRMITGAMAIIAAAASRAHCVCSTEMKLNMATVTGRTRLPPSTTANRNSFHELRNTNTMVTAIPPFAWGRITYR